MVPGLGHLYQRRFAKGILYFVCILGLFGYGVLLGGPRTVYFRWNDKEWSYPYLAQVWTGLAAFPALFRPLDTGNADGENERDYWRNWEKEQDRLHREYGRQMDLARMFTVIAGLLNVLAIYDAFAGPALYDEELAMKEASDRTEGAG